MGRLSKFKAEFLATTTALQLWIPAFAGMTGKACWNDLVTRRFINAVVQCGFIRFVLTSLREVVEVAPTICHLLGWPMPKNVEGGIVYEALEDPDWYLRA